MADFGSTCLIFTPSYGIYLGEVAKEETYLKNVSYAPLMMVDTADHGITGTDWRYKLVDLHHAIDSYEAGDDLGYINETLYHAMQTALDDIHEIFGVQFDRFDANYQPNTAGEMPVPEQVKESA